MFQRFFLCVVLAFSTQLASAAEVTYQFTFETRISRYFGSDPSIAGQLPPPGEVVSGTFTYDTDATGTPNGVFVDYPQAGFNAGMLISHANGTEWSADDTSLTIRVLDRAPPSTAPDLIQITGESNAAINVAGLGIDFQWVRLWYPNGTLAGSNLPADLPPLVTGVVSGDYIDLRAVDASNSEFRIFGTMLTLDKVEDPAPMLGVTLTQATSQSVINTSHEVTATVTDQDEQPVGGQVVSFSVTSGQHIGAIGTTNTDSNGVATISYIGTTIGSDTVQATIDDSGTLRESNPLVVEWISPPNQPPVAVCQDVYASTNQGSCSASVSVDGGSSDPDGDLVTTTQSPAGPYLPGVTNVVLNVTDGELSDSCSAVVTVEDDESPSVSCSNPVVKECSDGGAVGEFTATAADNCAAGPVTCTSVSGDIFGLGENLVTCSVMDEAGNAASCDTSVTVVDTVAPEVNCNIPNVELKRRNFPLAITATATDACATPDVTVEFLGCTRTRNGKPARCSVSASGDTITIEKLGASKTAHWRVTADDGTQSVQTECSISRPGKPKSDKSKKSRKDKSKKSCKSDKKSGKSKKSRKDRD